MLLLLMLLFLLILMLLLLLLLLLQRFHFTQRGSRPSSVALQESAALILMIRREHLRRGHLRRLRLLGILAPE